MKALILSFVVIAAAFSSFAQTPLNSTYPTRLETVLRLTGVVVVSSSQIVGTEQGNMFGSESNTLTLAVRTETAIAPGYPEKVYGLALQFRESRNWRSQITYVDYDELDGLIAGINKLLALQPDLPVVQARFTTRGGLIASTYSTEKREVLGWLEINNDDTARIQTSLDTLRDFRALLVTAKQNLDQLKSAR
jgi:hypothetical protein